MEEVQSREARSERKEKELIEQGRANETRQAELAALFDIANRKHDLAVSAIANVFILYLYFLSLLILNRLKKETTD